MCALLVSYVNSSGARNICCSAYWGYVCTAGFIYYSFWSKESD